MNYKAKGFEDYVKEETEPFLKGNKLLTPEMVIERLGITKRQLQELTRGENPHGLFLPAIRLGKKTIRYRMIEVLRLEFESQQISHTKF